MMTRIAFFTLLLAALTGCSAVVNNTLEMKDGDSGPSGCSNDDDCTDDNPCNGLETCVGNACRDGDSMMDGTPCTTPTVTGVCMRAICVVEEGCGDGVVQGSAPFDEECDDGANGNPSDGCTDECRYSCHSDEECNDLFECNGDEICSIPTGTLLRRCQPEGNLPAPMSACNVGLGGEQRCVMASMQLFCCSFDATGTMPTECCRPEGTPGEFVCGEPPPP